MNVFEGLAGKAVVVSGGSRGIGEAIVLELARQGANVVFSYLTRENAAQEVVRKANESGERAFAVASDARDPKATLELVKLAVQRFGRIDAAVSCAGVVRPAPLALMKDADWDLVLQTNLQGTFYLCRAVVQHLLKQRQGGSIVNVSSVAGLAGIEGQTNYSASKAGVIAITASLAREVATYGIRVNAVAPGWIDTAMVHMMPDERLRQSVERVPMRRLGLPQEVANGVCFLLSDAASYITGTVLRIDGGFSG